MTYKLIIIGLLLLNTASGVWSAKILYKNNDTIKSVFSTCYSLSCFVLLCILVIVGNGYHQIPLIALLISSLLLFTIDRIRGKNELNAKGEK